MRFIATLSRRQKRRGERKRILTKTRRIRYCVSNHHFAAFSPFSTILHSKENNFLTPGPSTNVRKSGRKIGEQVSLLVIFTMTTYPFNPSNKWIMVS